MVMQNVQLQLQNTSGLFYVSALKLLKQDYGNPLVVSYKKVKAVLDQPQIQPNDKTSLRRYHQSLRSTFIWLKSMGYNSAIQSVENVTKAVMRLPRFMRSKFYQDFKMYNQIAAIIETRKNTKQNHSDKNKDNKYNRQQHSIFKISGNNSNTNKQKLNLKCWFCNNNDHKVSLCPEIKDLSYPDKIKTIKDKKLCFNCLSNTHLINKSKSKISCKIDGCKKRHHTILHPPNPLPTNPPATNITTDTDVHSQNAIDQYRSNRAYLQIVPVKLMNKHIVVETNALLDTGSDTTLLRSDIATKLQLNSKIVTFDIKLDEPAKSFDIKACVVESFNLPKVQYDVNEMKSKFSHLADITFPEFKEDEVTLLIGANYMDLLLHRDYIKGKIGEPIAIKSVFGWILVGSDINVNCNFENFKNTNVYCNFTTDFDDLNKNICKFWEIESYGTLPKSALLPPYDQKALEILENTTKFKNDYFEVGHLWKDELSRLSNNRELALTRFKSLEKKFRKNPDFHELYKTQIKEYLELGHAKELTREESRNASAVTSYIPHHGVMNIHKPGRVRVVFDASAKYQGTSLNENLLPRIDFLNDLVNVITKFRTGEYEIIGDIDKMFHQVRVCESDIDALRFVWRENLKVSF